MKRYIDGFILSVPRERLSDYESIARDACALWKEHGALDYWECVEDDLDTECSKRFDDLLGAKENSVVVFAWAIFPSRAARDEANSKMGVDPRMVALMERLTDTQKPIIEFQSMTHGGFTELVSLRT